MPKPTSFSLYSTLPVFGSSILSLIFLDVFAATTKALLALCSVKFSVFTKASDVNKSTTPFAAVVDDITFVGGAVVKAILILPSGELFNASFRSFAILLAAPEVDAQKYPLS